MRRAGGWFLGLLVVGAMAGGGGYALRRAVKREVIEVVFLKCGRDPTDQAIVRGGKVALAEAAERAGRFRVKLVEAPLQGTAAGDVWIGTSGALLQQGDLQPPPFFISVVDTHPLDAAGHFRIVPGYDRQGRAAAAWAKRSKASRVFVLCDRPSLRSMAIADSFRRSARELGVTVLEPVGSSTERPDLQQQMLSSGADLLFYSGEEAPYGTAYALFSALRALGYQGAFLMAEADPEVSFLATRPGLVDGTVLVTPFAPAPPQLASVVGTTHGPHVTAGYFAMKAALDAIDHANSREIPDLRRAAEKLPYFDLQGRAALRKCALYVARNGVFEFVELVE